MRRLWVLVRVLGSLAIVAAVAAQLHASVRFWGHRGVHDLTTQMTNFFSFFTIDSNVATAAFFLVGAIRVGAGATDTVGFGTGRAMIATYMVTTGAVYNLLLRNVELPQGLTVAWSNEILHVVAPALVLVDWLFAPGRLKLPWKTLWFVVSFPLAWTAYTMIRGPLVHDELNRGKPWYPYPFLNPASFPNGYGTVALFVVGIAVLITGVGAGVVWWSRRPARS